MRKIIGKICPFSMEQPFFVYTGDELVARFSIKQDNFTEELLAAVEKYGAVQVDLTGSKSFNNGLKRQVEQSSKFKYNFSNIIINVI